MKFWLRYRQAVSEIFNYREFKGFALKNPDEGSALDPQAFEKA